MTEGDNRPHEIIIIKRGSEEEHEHHGGAWKIAFADFMTAMMALFLVLWLINAANEETKKAVASYFNPVKLVDRNQSKKGLDEQKGGPIEGAELGGVPETTAEKNDPALSKANEEAFFRDPFTALADIAAKEAKNEAQNAKGGGDNASKLPGEADPFPDPFDPKPVETLAQQTKELPKNAAEGPIETQAEIMSAKAEELSLAPNMPVQKDASETKADDHASERPATAAGEKGLPSRRPKDETEKAELKIDVAHVSALKADIPPYAGDKKSAEVNDDAKAKRKQRIEDMSKSILSDIKKQMGLAFDNLDKMDAALSVRSVDEGVLISVTDVFNYSMFEIGSAVPRGPIVLAMEKIAQVVGKQPGPLRIYGHTDGRPFRGASEDNWHLSSARALAAYYMLIRAGLDEKRVTQVTGFADRELKVAADPNADVNRRIELLLEVE